MVHNHKKVPVQLLLPLGIKPEKYFIGLKDRRKKDDKSYTSIERRKDSTTPQINVVEKRRGYLRTDRRKVVLTVAKKR